MSKPVLYAGVHSLRVDLPGRRAVADALRRFHQVHESAPAVERTAVREASMGGATAAGPGRMQLRLIKAGWSLNGNLYPADVLREAAGSKAWPMGTRCYVDHASDDEERQHPSGSVKNLAAVLTEDARWDEPSQSLVAEARLFEPWRGPLTEMAEAGAVGMSIRAWVTGQQGERDGREGFIVDWCEGRSVDFVTVPAAGGEVISVLEAVGAHPVTEAASLGAWLESRLHLTLTQYADDMYGDGQLTRDERITLSSAIGDALQTWSARVEQDAPQLFQRDRWTDAPDPEPVQADETTESTDGSPPAPDDVTDGTPPPAPATSNDEEEPVSGSQTGAPPEQAGTATVPDIESTPTVEAVQVQVQPTAESIAAIVAAAVREATGPLTATIADLTTRESKRDAADRDARHRQTAIDAVSEALTAAEHTDVAPSIRTRVVSRVTSAVPTTAEGAVDPAALGELITAVITDEATHVRRERANALAEAGVGLPYSMGAAPAQEAVDDGLEAELTEFFEKSLGMPATAAKVAAKGRG